MIRTPRRRAVLLAVPMLLCAGATTPAAAVPAPVRAHGAPSVRVSPAIRRALAPTGRLRVAVYNGGPTSMVRLPSGERAGIAYDLGYALGRELGVPIDLVEFDRVAEVVDALKAGRVDFSVTNATPVRRAVIDYTDPVVEVELGYIVMPGSPVKTMAEADRPGNRIGVTAGSTSVGVLKARYRHATLVPAVSLTIARALLAQHKVDAYATNKGVLYQLSDQLPGSRVLDGHWGLEHMAVGVPKGRAVGFAYVQRFVRTARASGLVTRAARHAGLRGAILVK